MRWHPLNGDAVPHQVPLAPCVGRLGGGGEQRTSHNARTCGSAGPADSGRGNVSAKESGRCWIGVRGRGVMGGMTIRDKDPCLGPQQKGQDGYKERGGHSRLLDKTTPVVGLPVTRGGEGGGGCGGCGGGESETSCRG